VTRQLFQCNYVTEPLHWTSSLYHICCTFQKCWCLFLFILHILYSVWK